MGTWNHVTLQQTVFLLLAQLSADANEFGKKFPVHATTISCERACCFMYISWPVSDTMISEGQAIAKNASVDKACCCAFSRILRCVHRQREFRQQLFIPPQAKGGSAFTGFVSISMLVDKTIFRMAPHTSCKPKRASTTLSFSR